MKKHEPARRRPGREPERAALGLEAEFVFLVDDQPVDPREALGDPRAFLGPEAMHRVGSSYHLPTGGAVYFDTGVIELVTPVIELDPGAPSRVVRSLWEGICAVREGLDGWGEREGVEPRLVGFSTHHNVSLPELGDGGRIAAMARLLVDVLAFPVMLFATNRRSTGVGVRPRPGRLEVTVDFTPDPALMTATTAIIVAAAEEVTRWAVADVAEAVRRGYPVLAGVTPLPHTSRKGWLVQPACFPSDPFRTGPDARIWRTARGETLSMRRIVRRTVGLLLPRIRAVAEPSTVELIRKVLTRRHPSLLDLDDRPRSYEDVGRACAWREDGGRRPLPRSLYEQAMLDATGRRPIIVDGRRWLPVATRGWTRVLYERDDGRRRTFSVDELVRLRRRAGPAPEAGAVGPPPTDARPK